MSFYEVKKGDKIFVRSSNYTSDYLELDKVIRTTKTQVILSEDKKFYKNNGRLVGADKGPWSTRYWLEPINEENEKLYHQQELNNLAFSLLKKIRYLDKKNYSEEEVRCLKNAVNFLCLDN